MERVLACSSFIIDFICVSGGKKFSLMPLLLKISLVYSLVPPEAFTYSAAF